MYNRQDYIYIGLDLHKDTNTAAIVNHYGDMIETITFGNRPQEYPEFLDKVLGHCNDLKPVFGLEDVGGNGRRLAVFLLENKQIVKEVNAAYTAIRRRRRATVRKNDNIDAECVAKVLIDEINNLPDAKSQDIYWTLNQLVLWRTSLVKDMVMLMGKLHAQLYCSYPTYKEFFSQVDGDTALEFWHTYPSPQYLKGVTVEELTGFLRKASHNSLSIRKAKAILELVSKGNEPQREYQSQRDFLVKSLVRQIKSKKEEIEAVEVELKGIVNKLDFKLDTMKGIDIVTAASLAAEIGDINRFSNANKLALFAGIAPIPYESGGKVRNIKNKQGNRDLHSIIYFLAVRQIQVAKNTKKPVNPILYEYYKKKVSEGKTQQQAVICVARRLVNIIYSIMKNGTAYVMPEMSSEAKGKAV